jgi:hypothetical protein
MFVIYSALFFIAIFASARNFIRHFSFLFLVRNSEREEGEVVSLLDTLLLLLLNAAHNFIYLKAFFSLRLPLSFRVVFQYDAVLL